MKTLTTLYQRMEANLLLQYLSSNGIQAVINGSHDYSSIVTGIDQGVFKIEVNEGDFEKASQLLQFIKNQGSSRPSLADDAVSQKKGEEFDRKRHLKKAIVFAFFGIVVLPVIFNILSVGPFLKYWRLERSPMRRNFWLMLYLLTHVASVVALIYTMKGIGLISDLWHSLQVNPNSELDM